MSRNLPPGVSDSDIPGVDTVVCPGCDGFDEVCGLCGGAGWVEVWEADEWRDGFE